jgi:hypothetical protein
MIYLVATKHFYQNYYNANFYKYIRKLVKKHKISAIAEEYSQDAADAYAQDKQSLLLKLSKELNLEHLYCDPGKARRRKLGIPSRDEVLMELGLDNKRFLSSKEEELVEEERKKSWEIREREWLNKIIENNLTNKDTLVVIGEDHKESFSKLLEGKKLRYKLCKLRIGKTLQKEG